MRKRPLIAGATLLFQQAAFAAETVRPRELSPADAAEMPMIEPPRVLYPAKAKENEESGVVGLKSTIDKMGNTTSVRVVQSSGHPLLDEAAVRAYERVTYAPYIENGEPIEVIRTGAVRFSLPGKPGRLPADAGK